MNLRDLVQWDGRRPIIDYANVPNDIRIQALEDSGAYGDDGAEADKRYAEAIEAIVAERLAEDYENFLTEYITRHIMNKLNLTKEELKVWQEEDCSVKNIIARLIEAESCLTPDYQGEQEAEDDSYFPLKGIP